MFHQKSIIGGDLIESSYKLSAFEIRNELEGLLEDYHFIIPREEIISLIERI